MPDVVEWGSNVFTASVDAEWPTKEHELVIKSEGRQSIYSYKPPQG